MRGLGSKPTSVQILCSCSVHSILRWSYEKTWGYVVYALLGRNICHHSDISLPVDLSPHFLLPKSTELLIWLVNLQGETAHDSPAPSSLFLLKGGLPLRTHVYSAVLLAWRGQLMGRVRPSNSRFRDIKHSSPSMKPLPSTSSLLVTKVTVWPLFFPSISMGIEIGWVRKSYLLVLCSINPIIMSEKQKD